MAKTGKQVQGDVYQLLKDSTLYSMISGGVYRSGYRPRDSKLEDAVVVFITGVPTQIQKGVVVVNIYVPDIDHYNNGVLVEDGERTAELEILAQEWADSLSCEVSCYKFKLQETITTVDDEEIDQHFVSIKLRYEYFGDDYAPMKTPQEAIIDATDTEADTGYMPMLETEDGQAVVITPVIERSIND